MAGKFYKNILGSKYVWLMLSLLLLVVIVLLWYSKNRENQLSIERIQTAHKGLQERIDLAEKNYTKQKNDGADDDYLRYLRCAIESRREGLRKLDSLPEGKLTRPILIAAFMSGEPTEEGVRWRLGFLWLEHGFDVTGFYLVDEAGNVTEFPDVLTFYGSPARRKFYRFTAWRDIWFAVITDASDKSWQRAEPTPCFPVLIPPLDYSKWDVQLGLMTKVGREPSTVVVEFRDSRFWNKAHQN